MCGGTLPGGGGGVEWVKPRLDHHPLTLGREDEAHVLGGEPVEILTRGRKRGEDACGQFAFPGVVRCDGG